MPRTGRPKLPSTAYEPLLRAIFAEQDRLNISTAKLAKISNLSPTTIAKLRHPHGGSGKNASLNQVRRLAEALDFQFPSTLRKTGDHP